MKKKSVFAALALLLGLAIVAYVFLTEPPAPAATAESPPSPKPAVSTVLPKTEKSDAQKLAERLLQSQSVYQTIDVSETLHRPRYLPKQEETVRPVIPDTRPVIRDSGTSGAVTSFKLKGGAIGYLDVDSIIQDRDPHSLIALLLAHRELTGASESLELEIRHTREYVDGLSVSFYQLIDGKPRRHTGRVSMDLSGAVQRIDAVIIDPQAVPTNSVVVLLPEAEVIALEAAARYAETLPPWPELVGEPLSVELSSFPGELEHLLDTEHELRAVWKIPVEIGAPSPDSALVWVDAETGEVLGTRSSLLENAAACTKPTFAVCDAEAQLNFRNREITSCDHHLRKAVYEGNECQLEPARLSKQPKYKNVKDTGPEV